MHFIYFAEQKLERYYDYLVESTQETTTKAISKEVSGQAGVKFKAGLGPILAALGLADLGVEGDVSTGGKRSFSEQTVSKFTSAQKLKALMLKLDGEGRLANLDKGAVDPLEVGMPVGFEAWMHVDTSKRSEVEIRNTGAVILTGDKPDYKLEIQATIAYMESENAWRRLLSKRLIAGFGTLIGIDREERFVEIDPIVFGYAQESTA